MCSFPLPLSCSEGRQRKREQLDERESVRERTGEKAIILMMIANRAQQQQQQHQRHILPSLFLSITSSLISSHAAAAAASLAICLAVQLPYMCASRVRQLMRRQQEGEDAKCTSSCIYAQRERRETLSEHHSLRPITSISRPTCETLTRHAVPLFLP